jgi:hypothetical protein
MTVVSIKQRATCWADDLYCCQLQNTPGTYFQCQGIKQLGCVCKCNFCSGCILPEQCSLHTQTCFLNITAVSMVNRQEYVLELCYA